MALALRHQASSVPVAVVRQWHRDLVKIPSVMLMVMGLLARQIEQACGYAHCLTSGLESRSSFTMGIRYILSSFFFKFLSRYISMPVHKADVSIAVEHRAQARRQR